MLDLISFIFELLDMWGLIAGLLVAATLTYVISHFLWGEFHWGLFTGLAILFAPIGVIVQSKIEK
jgi:hypothetical protein